jgi:hypothetical protein
MPNNELSEFEGFYFSILVTFTKKNGVNLKLSAKNKYILYFSLILCLLLGSCASGKRPGKLPKKGPIPCPVKDC